MMNNDRRDSIKTFVKVLNLSDWIFIKYCY